MILLIKNVDYRDECVNVSTSIVDELILSCVCNTSVIYSLMIIRRSTIIPGSYENQHINVVWLGILGLLPSRYDSLLRINLSLTNSAHVSTRHEIITIIGVSKYLYNNQDPEVCFGIPSL